MAPINRIILKRIALISLLFLFLISCAPAPSSDKSQNGQSEKKGAAPTVLPSATPVPIPDGYVAYESQSGDTIPVIAAHFGVDPGSIITEIDLKNTNFDGNAGISTSDAKNGNPQVEAVNTAILDPGTVLYVKNDLDSTTLPERLFPDSDVIFSPSTIDFDINAFVFEKGGYLAEHSELMTSGTMPSTDIIHQFALTHSINPRILLSILEHESGWLTNQTPSELERRYPMGWERSDRGGIVRQTSLLIREITIGYYSWRDGSVTQLEFPDGETLRISPYLNAGTVGVMYALSQFQNLDEWQESLYGERGIPVVHEELFGDAWARASSAEPLFEAGIEQPQMNFPFSPNQVWAFTCGPHAATIANPDLPPKAALDFAPTIGGPGCNTSRQWATAAAAGLVTRSVGSGTVYIDLDMDGYEQTGWVLYYQHIGSSGRVEAGTVLEQDDPVGHPSCVGDTTGTHVHIARKYNGEWVLADGGLPFTLSGYRAYNGDRFCFGSLEDGERVISANPYGNYYTRSIRPESDERYFYTPTPRP